MFVAAFALAAFASGGHAAVVFDNISSFQNGVAGASGTTTSSAPNTFLGGAYTLAAGTTTVTGFDLYPVNLVAATNYTALKLNLYVWGTVNTGAVSAAAPAFGNLLGSYSFTSTGTYTTGFYYPFESAAPGVLPGLTLTTPLAVSGSTIGVTVNVQGSTDGVTFASVQNLTSLITYGVAPTTGSMPFNGYYRNGNNETNGNFTTGVRSLGFTNQGVAVRVYGDVSPVPEPQTWAMMAMGLAALLVARRKNG